jgi:hypothetical protein
MSDRSNPVGTDQTEIAAKENGRRRLVRGAVSLAPIVLTLRSGALAAASCTGARLVRINQNNRIGENRADALGLTTSDVCFPDATVCEGSPTTGLTKINSTPTQGFSLTENPNGSLSCGTSNLRGQQVAILSSTSAASLGFVPRV